jgi:hypothetical protein
MGISALPCRAYPRPTRAEVIPLQRQPLSTIAQFEIKIATVAPIRWRAVAQ